MPPFVFSGAYGRHYPESRDAQNLPVGQVEPGDTRDLNEPLDGDWTPAAPADDPDRPAKSAPKEEWQSYAADTGLAKPGDAEGLTKAQLIDLTSPGKPDGKSDPGKAATDTKAGTPGKEA